MSALWQRSASAHLLQMLLIALITAALCHASGDAQRTGFDADLTEPLKRKSDDAKRPFGGGSFSHGHSYDGRWMGQASLTPWPMSKYVNRQDAKRHNRERSTQPRVEPNDWSSSQRYPVDKRPFGPGVYARPSGHRTVKRPFGGGVIFSRSRDDGNSKSKYRRYGYSRERRERQFQDSPNHGISDLSTFRNDGDVGTPDDVSAAWLKIADALQRSRPLYNGRNSKMNDDYGDDEYNNIEFVEEQDEGNNEDNSRSQPGELDLEISDNPFKEKRKPV